MAGMAVLRDGSEVAIRELTAHDAPVLKEAFERLSRESRDLRFLGAKPKLSARELEYLTDVDGHTHEALGAVDASTGEGVGVARFVRLAPDAPVAEVAVTVVDSWQRRGLGTLLLEQLSERARAEGIERYTALVSGENRAVVGLLDSIGAHVLATNAASGTVQYEVELPSVGLGHSLRAALRAAASGRMTLPRRIADALGSVLDHAASAARSAQRDNRDAEGERDGGGERGATAGETKMRS
jgi:GNAT superfamily N-acetyltransferase